jgi:hypothetical protein
LVVIGSSAKKSLEVAWDEAGFEGGGMPVMAFCVEWLEDGGVRLPVDI